ncbi:MAG TPA: glycosidase [Bacteroidota bacterium]|jgi:predicted GH43/DUF377 family glycosyl hydrolase|nr:glycosidase [Bacteroidota bacterium]
MKKSQHQRLPRIERLHGGKPVLQKILSHPWENKVTFNPACVFVADQRELARIIPNLPFDERTKELLRKEPGLCFLFYRAQGMKTEHYDYTRSSIGLAVLDAKLNLLARHSEPVLLPDQDYDNLGVEDARISKVGDTYIMTYTAYSSHTPNNRIRIALAATTDFVHWTKHGLLRGEFNTIDNKNAMLFEGTVEGKYLMIHRPMEGEHPMSIHWAEAEDVMGTWKTRGLLMKPLGNPGFVDTWIGGGAPPLKLEDGRFLKLYHIGNRKADGSREYDLGAAILDFSKKEIVLRRDEPLLRPESTAETEGDAELGVNNVVFICGAYFWQDDLYFPYAGADSVVLGGKIPAQDLEAYL